MFKCLHFADPSDQNVCQLMLANTKKEKPEVLSKSKKCLLNVFVFADPSDQNVCPFNNIDKRKNIYLKFIVVQ